MVRGEHQGRGEAHYVARGEELPGGVVGGFGELADQVLEYQAHLVVADGLRVQVDAGELGRYQVQQVGLFELNQPV